MLENTQYAPVELIAGLKRNEQRAFEEFYSLYAAALFGIIYRIVPDDQAAGRLLEESFLEFHKNILDFDPDSCTAFTCIMRICIRKANLQLRILH